MGMERKAGRMRRGKRYGYDILKEGLVQQKREIVITVNGRIQLRYLKGPTNGERRKDLGFVNSRGIGYTPQEMRYV
jgi:hypothetical protein